MRIFWCRTFSMFIIVLEMSAKQMHIGQLRSSRAPCTLHSSILLGSACRAGNSKVAQFMMASHKVRKKFILHYRLPILRSKSTTFYSSILDHLFVLFMYHASILHYVQLRGVIQNPWNDGTCAIILLPKIPVCFHVQTQIYIDNFLSSFPRNFFIKNCKSCQTLTVKWIYTVKIYREGTCNGTPLVAAAVQLHISCSQKQYSESWNPFYAP